jgi:hypothetical protein
MTEKWEDPWFRKLKPNEKLLYLYMCERCDIAGFWPIDFGLASYLTNIPTRALQGAYKGLAEAYIEHGGFVWLRDFVRQQRNWPLNEANKAHAAIIARLKEHSEFQIDFIEELKLRPLQGASKPPWYSIGNGNGISKVIDKSKNEIFDEFETEFWPNVPVKIGKGDAREAYIKARKKTSKEDILAGLPKYKDYEAGRSVQQDYRPLHPATWLNQERWTDVVQHVETIDEKIDRVMREDAAKAERRAKNDGR